MPEVLKYLMTQSDEQFQRQIQYILEQLSTPDEVEQDDQRSINANDDQDMEDEDDEEDEEDEVQEEEGEFDDIIDLPGILVGEGWLQSEFLLN